MTDANSLRVGLTLPSFQRDVQLPLAIARRAEVGGVDGVFVYDHMFRNGADGARRPAIECFALLTALAVETTTIRLGTLVIRASLRPPALVAQSIATIAAIAGPRLVAGIGAGDTESIPEHAAFGVPFLSLGERVEGLRATARAVSAQGVDTWIGGSHPRVRAAAAEVGGWNLWGSDPDRFAAGATELHAANPDATATWGGLVVLDDTDAGARTRAERLGASPDTIVGAPRTVATALEAYRARGAAWVVLAPVDASNPDNAEWVAAVRREVQSTG